MRKPKTDKRNFPRVRSSGLKQCSNKVKMRIQNWFNFYNIESLFKAGSKLMW